MNALYLHVVAFLITKYTTSYVNFELTLKQMEKKLKVSLKQLYGYLYAVIILQLCEQCVPATPYCQPRLKLVPMCGGVNLIKRNFVLHKRVFSRKGTIALGCLIAKIFPFYYDFNMEAS